MKKSLPCLFGPRKSTFGSLVRHLEHLLWLQAGGVLEHPQLDPQRLRWLSKKTRVAENLYIQMSKKTMVARTKIASSLKIKKITIFRDHFWPRYIVEYDKTRFCEKWKSKNTKFSKTVRAFRFVILSELSVPHQFGPFLVFFEKRKNHNSCYHWWFRDFGGVRNAPFWPPSALRN